MKDRDRTGDVIDGHYRLLSLIDRGGQGAIYRSLDMRDGSVVAIKMLNGEFATDPNSRERLHREAQALITLVGTAAVRVYDQCWCNGELFVVMELLEGSDLQQHLERRDAPMQPLELVELLQPIAHTLYTAHEHGIVHRDLKPANIYITRHGEVRLLDFGFAKFTQLLSFTAMGSAAGSPSYMAPEIWNAKEVDHRTDIYSLGVLVFRALAGRVPFEPGHLGLLWKAVTTAPRPSLCAIRTDLPPVFDGWIAQAMAIDPAARFLNVRAAWQSLREICS